jgi:copper oxidase (laccase) domain-containing protein
VLAAFRDGGAGAREMEAWFTPGRGDRWMLDLERANRDQLVRAGLRQEAIFTSGLCTKTHRDRFHSYRGDGAAAGRLLAAIRVP